MVETPLAPGLLQKMAESNKTPSKKFSEFLESTPPYSVESISDLFGEGEIRGSGWIYPLGQPDVQLFCESCEGPRYFQNVGEQTWVGNDKIREVFLKYVCRNCRSTVKSYAAVLTNMSGIRSGRRNPNRRMPTAAAMTTLSMTGCQWKCSRRAKTTPMTAKGQ
jgi:hypothetical protein